MQRKWTHLGACWLGGRGLPLPGSASLASLSPSAAGPDNPPRFVLDTTVLLTTVGLCSCPSLCLRHPLSSSHRQLLILQIQGFPPQGSPKDTLEESELLPPWVPTALTLSWAPTLRPGQITCTSGAFPFLCTQSLVQSLARCLLWAGLWDE